MTHASTALLNHYNSIVPSGAEYVLRVRGLSRESDFSEKEVVSYCVFIKIFYLRTASQINFAIPKNSFYLTLFR